MPKRVMPFFEEKPYYMSAIGMSGARFLEGNDGTGGEGVPPKPKPEGDNPAPKTDGDEPLGEGGKKALEAERARAKTAERELAKLREAETAREREQMSEAERLKAELEDERTKNKKLENESSIHGLVITHGLSADDSAFLASVEDVTQRESLAKRLAVTAKTVDPKKPVRSLSGTGGWDLSTGSIADYRREIAEKRAL